MSAPTEIALPDRPQLELRCRACNYTGPVHHFRPVRMQVLRTSMRGPVVTPDERIEYICAACYAVHEELGYAPSHTEDDGYHD